MTSETAEFEAVYQTMSSLHPWGVSNLVPFENKTQAKLSKYIQCCFGILGNFKEIHSQLYIRKVHLVVVS